ncbi:MAG: hypothetical protein FWH41_07905 [Treponema sp.]|nr:hypothetical protein [Treponema sp.]
MDNYLLSVLAVIGMVLLFVIIYKLGKKKSQSKQNLPDGNSVTKNVTEAGDYYDAINRIQGGVLRNQTSIIPDDPDDTEGAVI